MNSEELLLRAAEERHAIVEKYRKGRHGGADIPAWEEPSYDVYHQLDRYGFIQDEKNQEVVSPKEIELNEQRVKKWIKMFHNWDKLGADKLRKRVYKGIPDKCRSTAWMLLLNVGKYQSHQMGHKNPSASDRSKLEQSNQKFKERRKKYEEMRELAWKYSPDIRQIDLDVNRTYREHIMFRDRYSSKQQELFNVLAAYSVYNMEIGYCQGMSQIVALLLMYLDEEQTFWALSTLVSDTKYSMHGFFIPGFPKLLRFQEHHDKIMNKFLPKLKKHLDKNSVDTGIYTLKWFFQCFLDRIPFKLTLRVWDIYLLEGESIMSAMAYNLLKMHQRQLIKLSMDDILHFIQVKLEKQYQFTEDATIESLQKCLDELKRYKLDHAGKPSPIELPKTPLGIFKPDAFTTSFEQKIGRRTSEFSSTEKDTQETVISRRDTAVRLASLPDRNSSIGTDASKYPAIDRSSESELCTDDRNLSADHKSDRNSAGDRNLTSDRTIDRNAAVGQRIIERNSFNEHTNTGNATGEYHASKRHSVGSRTISCRNSGSEQDYRNSAQFSTGRDSAYGDLPRDRSSAGDHTILRSSMQCLANPDYKKEYDRASSRFSTSDYHASEKYSESECSESYIDNLSDSSITELSSSVCTDTSRITTVDRSRNNSIGGNSDRDIGSGVVKYPTPAKNSDENVHTLRNVGQTHPLYQSSNKTLTTEGQTYPLYESSNKTLTTEGQTYPLYQSSNKTLTTEGQTYPLYQSSNKTFTTEGHTHPLYQSSNKTSTTEGHTHPLYQSSNKTFTTEGHTHPLYKSSNKKFTTESSFSIGRGHLVHNSTDVFVTNTGLYHSNEHFVRHYSHSGDTDAAALRIPRNSKYKKNTRDGSNVIYRKSDEFTTNESYTERAKKPTTLLVTHL